MISLVATLYFAASGIEPCATVRRDHEQFKAWAFSTLQQFNAKPKAKLTQADRARGREFEKKVELQITELNRRYATCREN